MKTSTLKRAVMTVVALSFLTGCQARRVREEASIALDCRPAKVSVREVKEYAAWSASGCGRAAVCRVPKSEGAD